MRSNLYVVAASVPWMRTYALKEFDIWNHFSACVLTCAHLHRNNLVPSSSELDTYDRCSSAWHCERCAQNTLHARLHTHGNKHWHARLQEHMLAHALSLTRTRSTDAGIPTVHSSMTYSAQGAHSVRVNKSSHGAHTSRDLVRTFLSLIVHGTLIQRQEVPTLADGRGVSMNRLACKRRGLVMMMATRMPPSLCDSCSSAEHSSALAPAGGLTRSLFRTDSKLAGYSRRARR